MSHPATVESNPISRLESSIVPVTALLSIGKFILLAGEGFTLRIYRVKTGDLLYSSQIFHSQVIHGFCHFSCCDGYEEVLIYGGHWIRLARFYFSHDQDPETPKVNLVTFQDPIRCPDWILSVCSQTSDNVSTLNVSSKPIAFAITAHDELLAISRDNRISNIYPGSGSFLFSAHLMIIDPNQLLVASGTAFGQIIVWTYSFKEISPGAKTHHVFTGHEGSIFGVQISNLIPVAHNGLVNTRLLSSCSDDRTIRVWDISDLSHTMSSGENQAHGSTGFTSTQSTNCLASIMGHESRIWQLRYIPINPSSSQVARILSIGEDASAQCWEFKFGSLVASSSFTTHCGKNLWSVDISKGQTIEDGTVFVGGADGRIARISVSDTDPSKNPWLKARSPYQIQTYGQKINNPNWQKQEEREPVQRLKGHIRSVALTTGDNAIIATEYGEVILCNLETGQFNQLGKFNQLTGYSTMCSTRDGEFVFIGGSFGDIFVYDQNSQQVEWIWRSEKKAKKIAGLWAERVSVTEIKVLASQLGENRAILIQFCRSSYGSIQPGRNWQLVALNGVVTSSAQFIDGNQTLISLGSRKGDIWIYHLDTNEGGEDTEFSPSLTLPQAHGSDTVTYMCWLGGSDKRTFNQQHLASVGRDGFFSVFRIRNGTQSTAECIHKLSLPFGPSLEGVWYESTSSTFVVYGFQSNKFIAYDVKTAQPIMVLPCGGAHRSWAFSPQVESRSKMLGGRFVWIQASELKSFTAMKPPWTILKDGAHGRDIKACAISPQLGEDAVRLLATGAEDTNIGLFRWCSENGEMKILTRIRRHETGIQCLKWSDDGTYLFSSGGVEEFFIWQIQPCPGLEVGIVCQDQLPIDVARSDLRITSFDIRKVGGESLQFFITLSYSNSVLKTYLYSPGSVENKWTLISSSSTPKFLTNISYIETTNGHYITSSSNDGYLSIQRCDGENTDASPSNKTSGYSLVTTSRIHQSSIRVCSVFKVEKTRFWVLTGGDDNAIALSSICMASTENPEATSFTTLLVPNAHAAAITAACLLSSPLLVRNLRTLIAFSCSTDQTIRKWVFHVNSESGSIDLMPGHIWRTRTSISDISDMDSQMIDERSARVLLCGAGLETWKFEVNFTDEQDHKIKEL